MANLTTLTGVVRDIEGNVVAHSKLEGDKRVATWASTGDRYEIPVGRTRLAPWVNGIWGTRSRLMDKGYSNVGDGEMNGRRSIVLESPQYELKLSPDMRTELGLPVDNEETAYPLRVSSLEIVEDAPLLWRDSVWDVGTGGERTLLRETRILEYELLDADTVIGPFE